MRGFVDQRQERVEFVRPAVEQVVGVLIFMFEGYCDASLTTRMNCLVSFLALSQRMLPLDSGVLWRDESSGRLSLGLVDGGRTLLIRM